MTDWKMPEWMEAILRATGGKTRHKWEIIIMRKLKDPVVEMIWVLMHDCRKHNLLSTPAERDANEQHIINLEAEIQVHKNSIVTLKALLKERRDERYEMGLLMEEAAERIMRLERERKACMDVPEEADNE